MEETHVVLEKNAYLCHKFGGRRGKKRYEKEGKMRGEREREQITYEKLVMTLRHHRVPY